MVSPLEKQEVKAEGGRGRGEERRKENAVSVVLSPQASVSQVPMNYKAFNAGTRKNRAQKAGILRKIPRILAQPSIFSFARPKVF